jgi:4-hydroxythreonine-4-phosphate dehydrogenase
MGDAVGIGPELTAKIVQEPRLRDEARILVIGDAPLMRKALALIHSSMEVHAIQDVKAARFEDGRLDVLDLPVLHDYVVPCGKADARCGEAAVAYVKRACQLALEGAIQATTSAPVNKEAVHLAGYSYAGQTEMFAEACGTTQYAMMLVSGNLRLLFVTNHLPLKEVCAKITPERVYGIIKLAYDALKTPGKPPKIAVAGLNPHAGDGGALGREEIEAISPAIQRAQADGMTTVIGPLPPDTIFLGARDGRYDAVISMYHDHGSTAMKLLGFQQIVTVLVGLPIIRTSVGHGTAFDIAGRGIADHGNLLEAALVAARMAQARAGGA